MLVSTINDMLFMLLLKYSMGIRNPTHIQWVWITGIKFIARVHGYEYALQFWVLLRASICSIRTLPDLLLSLLAQLRSWRWARERPRRATGMALRHRHNKGTAAERQSFQVQHDPSQFFFFGQSLASDVQWICWWRDELLKYIHCVLRLFVHFQGQTFKFS